MVETFVLINTKTESPQNQVLEDLKKILGVDEAYLESTILWRRFKQNQLMN